MYFISFVFGLIAEHSIVSRHEALERARKLNLDLVEVYIELFTYNQFEFKKEKQRKENELQTKVL